jgi:hypothetical protein
MGERCGSYVDILLLALIGHEYRTSFRDRIVARTSGSTRSDPHTHSSNA